MSTLDHSHASSAVAILGCLYSISIPVFIPWKTFKNKTSEQQHHEVIRDEKITFEPSQQSLHPLTVYHYCSELLLNMSSFSTKDQWNESRDLYPSENVGLVPIICFLLMITKRRFRYFLGRFSDFLAFYLPYPILLPLSFFYRLFKYLLVTLPMTCLSIIQSIFLKCWNFFLWITYPLQYCAKKGFEAFFFLFITLPWKIISWPWKKGSKNGYERLSGQDIEEGNLTPINDTNGKTVCTPERSRKPSFETKLKQVLEGTLKSERKDSGGDAESRRKEDFDRELEEYRNSLLKKIEEDVEKEKEFKERERQVNKSLEEAERKLSESRNRSRSEEESSEEENEERRQVEEEFRRKLEEQKRVHEEKLKELREERAEIERKAAEELQRIREESQQRMLVFLKCVELKMRFEAKEEEWKDMLDGLRKPLVRVNIFYNDLRNEIHYAIHHELEEWEEKELQRSGKSFASKVANAQDVLAEAFDQLKQLSETYDDRVFIKIVMKSVSFLGIQCDLIGQQLIKLLRTPTTESVETLNNLMSELSPHSVPTTTSLRRDAQNARNEDYVSIDEPPYPDWFHNFS